MNIENLKKFKFLSVSFGLSVFLMIGGFLWAYMALGRISEPLIIHFNSLRGINQIGSLWDVAKLSIFGLLVSSVNFLSAFELEKRDWFLAKLVASSSLFFSILIFIAIGVIIGVN